MPLGKLLEPLGVKRAAHLLRRATFGATKSQIDAIKNLTPAQAVASLFNTPIPDPVLPIDPETGQEWFLSGTTDANSPEFRLTQYFCGWFMAQMIAQDADESISLAYSAREKLVLFLHTHFTCIASKVQSSRALYFQNQLFRRFALDKTAPADVNFKTLTEKISVDNAMLKLLDGNLNVKGNPNENYARELLELYTVGRGLEGTLPQDLEADDYYVYTEEDVRAAAKVLSGWEDDDTFSTIDPDTNLPRGRVKGNPSDASAHNNDAKIFSARFGGQTINPDPLLLNGTRATEASALDEIRQLIDMIYSKPETSKNICWKLYRFFVYSPHEKYEAGNAVAKIDQEIIETLALTFKNNGYKIQPVIEEILTSMHFYDSGNGELRDDNFGGIIKSPLDLILGTFRTFNVKFPEMSADPVKFYEGTTNILYLMKSLGMNFYEPFDVAGYEAYHQFPIYNRIWITPGALAIRYNFIRILFRSANPEMFLADALEYVSENFSAQAGDAKQLVIAIATYLFPMTDNLTFNDTDGTVSPLTQKRLNFFLQRFLQDFDEAYWTTRWNEKAGDLREQLEFLLNSMLQTPEYQLA